MNLIEGIQHKSLWVFTHSFGPPLIVGISICHRKDVYGQSFNPLSNCEPRSPLNPFDPSPKL